MTTSVARREYSTDVVPIFSAKARQKNPNRKFGCKNMWNEILVYWFNPFRSRQRPFRLLIHSSLNTHDQSSRTLLTRKETNDNERRDFHMPLSQHCWAWVWKLWIVTYYPAVSPNAANGNMYTPKSKYSRTFWDKRVVRLLRWLSVNRKENNTIVSRNWWTSSLRKILSGMSNFGMKETAD